MKGGSGFTSVHFDEKSSHIFVGIEWFPCPFVVLRGNIDRDSVILTSLLTLGKRSTACQSCEAENGQNEVLHREGLVMWKVQRISFKEEKDFLPGR